MGQSRTRNQGRPAGAIGLLLVALSLVLTVGQVFAGDGPPPAVRSIQQSGQYHSGVGMGRTPSEAWNAALEGLASSLKVMVSVRTEATTSEEGDRFEKSTEQKITLTTGLPIHGCCKLAWRQDEVFHALAYVRSDSLRAGFYRYKVQARDRVKNAELALSDGRIDRSFRELFWAYLMISSLPDTCAVDLDGRTQIDGAAAIVESMRGIAQRIEVTATRVARVGRGYEVTLRATFDGRPVERLDFEYYRGHGQDYGSFRRGRDEVIELDVQNSNLVLLLQHRYEGEMRALPELLAADEALGAPDFDLRISVPVTYSGQVQPSPREIRSVVTGRPPRPVAQLLECEDEKALLDALGVYQRNGRIEVARRRGELPTRCRRVFVALVDDETASAPPVILEVVPAGYIDLRSHRTMARLDAFKGRKAIYIGVAE